MEIKIENTKIEDVYLVKFIGAVKSGDEFKIEEKLEEYLADNNLPKLIFDFKKVLFIASSALGMMLKLHKEIEKKRGRLILVNLNETVKNVLNMTKLSNIFEIDEELQDAMESLTFD